MPVREYDSDFLDSMHKGTHIVMCYPGGRSTRYGIDPAFAPMIAAGRYAEDAISQCIMNASSLRIAGNRKPTTPEQRRVWEELQTAFGGDLYPLEYCSYREAAESGVAAMQKEAEKLLKNPAVRAAYEQFMLLCELAKTNEDVNS